MIAVTGQSVRPRLRKSRCPLARDSVRAAKVTAVLIIKRFRTVLTRRRRYITK